MNSKVLEEHFHILFFFQCSFIQEYIEAKLFYQRSHLFVQNPGQLIKNLQMTITQDLQVEEGDKTNLVRFLVPVHHPQPALLVQRLGQRQSVLPARSLSASSIL